MVYALTNKEYSRKIPPISEINKSKLEKISDLGREEIGGLARVIATKELFSEQKIGFPKLINKISGYLVMKKSMVGYYLGLFEEIKGYGK